MTTAKLLKISVRCFFEFEIHIRGISRLHSSTIESFNKELQHILDKFKSEKNLLIIGDMNIIFLNSMIPENYKTIVAANGLECLVGEPTKLKHLTMRRETATCIDHVFARVACKNRMAVEVTVVHNGLTDHAAQRVCVG